MSKTVKKTKKAGELSLGTSEKMRVLQFKTFPELDKGWRCFNVMSPSDEGIDPIVLVSIFCDNKRARVRLDRSKKMFIDPLPDELSDISHGKVVKFSETVSEFVLDNINR